MANEKRLIYLDHALQAVSENYRSDMPKNDLDMLVAARKRLKSMPTMDAVEVVHGHWIRTGMHLLPYECSACGSKEEGRTNFCPNCGAKMDLKGE